MTLPLFRGDSDSNARDVCEDTIETSQDFIIAKAEDAKTALREVIGPGGILRDLLVMNRAIEFDDQVCGRAEEVGDERADGVLATEAEPDDFAALQCLPKYPLGGREFTPKLPRGFY